MKHITKTPLLVMALILGASHAAAQTDSAAQRVVVEGVVYDTLSGRPIPFAVLSVSNTAISTLAGRDGRYRLELAAGRWSVEVRKIGFRMTSLDLTANQNESGLDVYLSPIPVGLATIEVTAEGIDEATRIIMQAIARKNDLLSRINDYRYDAYIKFVLRDLERAEDSANSVVLITETQTTAYWEKPDKYQEVITARRQSSNLDAENNLVSVGQIVNFNRDRVDLQKYSVVSPTADDALDHYQYQILDTLTVDGQTVFRLAIEPKSDAAPLFVGMIDIADSTYNVMAIDVGANEAIRFDFLENLRYRQHLSDLGDDRWMPEDIHLTGEIHFGVPIPGFPEHILFEHSAVLDGFRFDEGNPPSTLGEFVVVVDEAADDLDSTAWAEGRAVPLTVTEQAAYARIDSLENVPPSVGRRVLRGLGGAVFLTSNPDFFHFNRVEGAYLGAGVTYRDLSPDVVLRAKLGYATFGNEWQYRFGAQYRFVEQQRLWLGAWYHREIVRRPTIVSNAYNPTYLAVLAKLDPLNYFLEEGLTVSLSMKLLNFTRLQLQYTDVDQSTVTTTTDFSILPTERTVAPNLAINPGRLRSMIAAFTYDSRPLLKSKGRDYYFQTLTSTRITAGVELASPSIIPNDFDYTRYFARLNSTFRTFNLGLTTITGYGGIAVGDLPPQRYYTVDFGKGAFFEAGGINTLNETNFFGNRTAMLVLSHDFDQQLFRRSRIPGIRDLPFTLTTHGGVFWSNFADHTPNPGDDELAVAPTAYTEIGFGVANLTPFVAPFNFGVYFSWQLSSYNTRGFQFRIGIPTQ